MDILTQTQQYLAFAWWLALCLSVLIYVALDGADLGAGIFSLFVRDEDERGAIMSAMAGTWDANETWLMVAGGILFGTFPFIYGSTFSYLLVPLALALWGIMSRAIALEFRHLADGRHKAVADLAFGLGSLVTTFFGAMAIGAVLQGFALTNTPGEVPTYVGGAFSFITPFSIWVGVASVVAVLMGGLLFVRARFEHGEAIRVQAARWTNPLFFLALAAVSITLIWTGTIFPWAHARWFGSSTWIFGLLLIATLFCVFKSRRASQKDHDLAAVLWFDATAVVMGVALMATMYPWIVPNTWTIYSGASPSISLVTFTLTMGGFIPVIIAYNVYQIWVFRDRVSKFAAYSHH
ncbi:MAG TPA: cytochrome d ubiquinol oxidase subunit II [Devosiaceae bacterium]|nr:cytochrome d ubiquinol oxidase subunit II [Devosiaceae bacterium]